MERLLQVLKANQGKYVSGEELAKLAGMTRAGIWKQINNLKEWGYLIESSPRKGYKLLDLTTALHPFEIKDNLGTARFGQTVYYQAEVDSTNNWGKILAAEGAPEGTVVIAERQTKGRGRMGRNWASEAGLGLWFSIIIRPQISAAALPVITILTAVSMAKAIMAATGIQVEVKWPNDLTYQSKKLAGILAELNGEMDRVNYLIIGIGLNINHLSANFPDELRERATSLRMVGNREFDRKQILQHFLRIFEADYQTLLAGEALPIIEYAKQHSATIGREITVNQGFGKTLTGTAVDLDRDGSLLLKPSNDGMELTKVFSGEIIETN
ncbi:MAG TPA: biotin--[acetyl-CoA-carboxylase] ligase [Bacillota bacterium]|jgi:BirA family biotin operon repressor/biotin-[acetyl-CoA-carboxylase] ligase|nr:biotin--[acetyl-CoA-carboxylase] ligase [Bacillota bacterium]HOL10816.1 biotin--[acetyl-CoA-carboxylase] ligase [Bacillota bacterium]HPO98510.1 biotin--[acetyl-CoA-carboxylase] ligase [Bacillota bacterium]